MIFIFIFSEWTAWISCTAMVHLSRFTYKVWFLLNCSNSSVFFLLFAQKLMGVFVDLLLVGRRSQARSMYEKLQSHPNPKVSKKARQFLFSFQVTKKLHNSLRDPTYSQKNCTEWETHSEAGKSKHFFPEKVQFFAFLLYWVIYVAVIFHIYMFFRPWT